MRGLGQIELRQPLALDRRITLGRVRRRTRLSYPRRISVARSVHEPYRRLSGATGRSTATTARAFGSTCRSLGLRTVRIDFATRRKRNAHELRYRPELLRTRERYRDRFEVSIGSLRSFSASYWRRSSRRPRSRPISPTWASSIRPHLANHAGLRLRANRHACRRISRNSTRNITPRYERGRSDADRQRVSLQFQQQYTDKQREIVGPLFQRAQLAIAQVACGGDLSVVVDKRIVIYGGQDVTNDVETLFVGALRRFQPPVASPPPVGDRLRRPKRPRHVAEGQNGQRRDEPIRATRSARCSRRRLAAARSDAR